MTLHDARRQVVEAVEAANEPFHLPPALALVALIVVSTVVMVAEFVDRLPV